MDKVILLYIAVVVLIVVTIMALRRNIDVDSLFTEFHKIDEINKLFKDLFKELKSSTSQINSNFVETSDYIKNKEKTVIYNQELIVNQFMINCNSILNKSGFIVQPPHSHEQLYPSLSHIEIIYYSKEGRVRCVKKYDHEEFCFEKTVWFNYKAVTIRSSYYKLGDLDILKEIPNIIKYCNLLEKIDPDN